MENIKIHRLCSYCIYGTCRLSVKNNHIKERVYMKATLLLGHQEIIGLELPGKQRLHFSVNKVHTFLKQ